MTSQTSNAGAAASPGTLVTPERIERRGAWGGEHLVYLDVDVVNQDGRSTTPGHAIVVLPSRSKRDSW